MIQNSNPYKYLYDLAHSDRAPGYDETWMTARLQQKWPGNYHVAPVRQPEGWINYEIVFNDTKDELLFTLKYL